MVIAGGGSLKLSYHRGDGDYGLRDYVYFWNLLRASSSKGCPVFVITDSSPYVEVTENWKRFAKKGLGTPKITFGQGGKFLTTTLFLHDDVGAIRHYWHGRAAVEDLLDAVAERGVAALAPFL